MYVEHVILCAYFCACYIPGNAEALAALSLERTNCKRDGYPNVLGMHLFSSLMQASLKHVCRPLAPSSFPIMRLCLPYLDPREALSAT